MFAQDSEPRTKMSAAKKAGRKALHRKALARKKIERWRDQQRLRQEISELW
jgi:hypothetical protein